MKADPAAQLRLIDLQALDAALARGEHRRRTLPELATIAAAEERLTGLRGSVIRAETEVGDLDRELRRMESDVEQVRARAARDQQRMQSGAVAPKELESLQHEVESLARRQSDLEDVELEVMEKREEAGSRLTGLRSEADEVVAEIATATAARDEAYGEIDAAAARDTADRTRLATEIPADLLALYDRIRQASGGVGAAVLAQRRCEGCRLELAGSELRTVRSAAPDDVLRCENCRRILVRTAESGVSRRLVVEADGGSRGNPGPAGYGAVVRDVDTGEVLAERAAGIGRATNNVAEYSGLIAGLEAAAELDPASVEVRMDSKLVVEQMSGRWRVKHPALAPLHASARALAGRLPSVRYGWIPRERNSYADRLANEAMDAVAAGRTWAPATAAPPATESSAGGSSAGGSRDGGSRAGGSPVGGSRDGTSLAGGSPAAGSRAGARESDADPESDRRPAARTAWRAAASPPTTVLLVRHGATELSGTRFSGRGDPALSEAGEAQAAAVATRLSTVDGIAGVVCSPLRRTRGTAALIAASLGLAVVEDVDLVETDFGRWDGLTFSEVKQGWPTEHAAWSGDPTVAPPGGESINQVARRVRRARDRLLAAYPGRTVVVVSHVTPIKLLLCSALGAPSSSVFRLHLETAGLSEADWYPDGPALVRLVNDTAHLR